MQRPLPPLPTALPSNINNEEKNEEGIPSPPTYRPVPPLVTAHLRLKEFMRNSISLSEIMGQALPSLNAKLKDKRAWPQAFLDLPPIQHNLWLQLLKKTIEKCSVIKEIDNPFHAATLLVNKNKEEFTLEDYKLAIAYIHSQSFDDMHNHGLKERAVNCIWFTLFFTPLMANPINMENLRSLLITPFQRLTRLPLYSKDGTADYNKLYAVYSVADNLPDDFKQVESQFQNLTARSLTIAKASNSFNTIIDKLISISKDWLDLKYFHLFLIELEPILVNHIEKVVSLILNEEKSEKEIIHYIENTFSSEFIETFNLQFSNELLEWVNNKILCTLDEAGLDRPFAIYSLKNLLKLIYQDNSLADLTKASKMVETAEGILNEIKSSIKLNINNPSFAKPSSLVEVLDPVIVNISKIVNCLQLNTIPNMSLQNSVK